ncbi:hypothetical protein BU16DRAFT_619183 [Lophium mytilinum]|uniref:BTB domain-containing protein n=1 Tax=Lophium mytilinum TaxID=390894 RepID=A0A6A6QNB5_9PEZI|nr:hypothetical protein BU16DRAFT_619183 [Lophium mytilinum]
MATPTPATSAMSATPATPATTKDEFVMPVLVPCSHPTPWPPDCFDDIVSVIVGEEKKAFRVHKGVLTYHSAFFAAALDGKFKEGVTQIVELPEDEVSVFQVVYCWLYTGRLYNPPEHPPSSSPSTAAEHFAGAEQVPLFETLICKVFVFADMKIIPELKNKAVDVLHLVTCTNWTFLNHQAHYIYSNTIDGSPLRKVITDFAAKSLGCESFIKFSRGGALYPTAFCLDVIAAIHSQGGKWDHIGREGWAKIDRCLYHDHSGPGGKLRRSHTTA